MEKLAVPDAGFCAELLELVDGLLAAAPDVVLLELLFPACAPDVVGFEADWEVALPVAEPAGLEADDGEEEEEPADDAVLDGRVEDVEELVVGDAFGSAGLDDPDAPDAVEDGDLSLTFSGFRSIVTGRFDPDDPELEVVLPGFADEPDPLPSDDDVPPGVFLSLAIYLSPAPSQSQDLNYTRLFAKR